MPRYHAPRNTDEWICVFVDALDYKRMFALGRERHPDALGTGAGETPLATPRPDQEWPSPAPPFVWLPSHVSLLWILVGVWGRS